MGKSPQFWAFSRLDCNAERPEMHGTRQDALFDDGASTRATQCRLGRVAFGIPEAPKLLQHLRQRRLADTIIPSGSIWVWRTTTPPVSRKCSDCMVSTLHVSFAMCSSNRGTHRMYGTKIDGNSCTSVKQGSPVVAGTDGDALRHAISNLGSCSRYVSIGRAPK